MFKRKSISVIIPAKNRIDLVYEAIDSVLTQLNNNLDLRIIVVDDGSTPAIDDSIQKRYPQIKVIRNETNKNGPGIARNIGFKNSDGDYIAFLDSDDKWKENFLSDSIKFLENNPITVASLCLTHEFFDGNFPLIRKLKIRLLNLARELVLVFNWLLFKKLPKSAFYLAQISHIVFKRKKISDILFNENSLVAEDWEFNFDVMKRGDVRIIPKKLVKFRYTMKSFTLDKKVIEGKKKAYYDLLSKLPKEYKKSIYYFLFVKYIQLFLVK